MQRIASFVLFAIGLTLDTVAVEYIYTISGTFTQQNLGSPDPTVTVGTPFTATFDFQLPGTPFVQNSDLGWYMFDDTQQAGSATLGSLNHWIERGRATSAAHSDALGRPRRSVRSLGTKEPSTCRRSDHRCRTDRMTTNRYALCSGKIR